MSSSIDIALTNLEPSLARRVFEAYDKEGKDLDFDQWAATKLSVSHEAAIAGAIKERLRPAFRRALVLRVSSPEEADRFFGALEHAIRIVTEPQP